MRPGEDGAVEDYYALVGVDRSASPEEIDRAVRVELRTWQRRTASPDLARRQEAERRVHQLGEARILLLDHQRRRDYNLRLGTTSPPASPAPTSPPPPEPARPAAVRSPPRGSPAIPEPGQGTEAAVWRPPSQHGWWVFIVSGLALAATVGMISNGQLGVAALMFLLALAPVAVFIRHRRRRVVIDATGVTLRASSVQHIPWAEVYRVQPVTVGSTLRLEIWTEDGRRIRAPAPIGVNTIVHDQRFWYQVAVMQRWHAYYTNGPGAATG